MSRSRLPLSLLAFVVLTAATVAKGDPPPLLVAPFDQRQAAAAQAEWAKQLGRQVAEKSPTTGMSLTLVPPGEFEMGSPQGTKYRDPAEKQHRVRITRPLYVGTYEVTVGQFVQFYKAANYQNRWSRQGAETGGGLAPDKEGKLDGAFEARFVPWDWGHPQQTDNHPAVDVSWNDATAFCDWLSAQDRRRYRLPTEAEWEYACRAGTTTLFYNGDEKERLAEIGNFADAALREQSAFQWAVRGRDGYPFTAPVGKFQPNAFGLYDTLGNAWERCADWYDDKYYGQSPMDDPPGPADGTLRIFRGGGWDYSPSSAAQRKGGDPAVRSILIGFRVVCEP